jgi:CheY-like chemotaxis protein
MSPEASERFAKTILIVDDDQDSAEMLGLLLETWGYASVGASDGPSALAMAIELRPQAVLLDLTLPGLDGYEVARRLRAAPATAACLIVALSGYGRPEDRKRTADAGFDAHLVKPLEPDVLEALLGQRCHK